MDSDDNQMRDICEKITKNYRDEAVRDAFSLIQKLLNNIINNPNEEKFRSFKKTNENIKKKILIIKETLEFMKYVGYADLDTEIMAYTNKDLTKLKTAVKVLQDYLDLIDKKLKEQEYLKDSKRHDEVKRHNEEITKKFAQEKLLKQKVQEQLEFDKKERSQKDKPKDSLGKDLNFGAKVCKFEPSKEKRG